MAVSVQPVSLPGPPETASLPTAAVGEAGPLARLMEAFAEETVTVDEPEAMAHKGRLRQLVTRLDEADFDQRLKGELKAYRAGAEQKIQLIQGDLSSTATALQDYVTRSSRQDLNQEKLLQADLDRLGTLGKISDLSQVRVGLDIVRRSIAGTVEQINAQNQAILGQLRAEILTLQKRLGGDVRRQDATGTLANRTAFEHRIRAKAGTAETFSLYLVRIANWKELIHALDQHQAESLITNVGDKLTELLGPETFSGRWYDGYFAAIVGIDKRTAMEGASDLSHRLAGNYSTSQAPVGVRIRVAVVEHIPGHEADQTLKRIDQLIRAFGD